MRKNRIAIIITFIIVITQQVYSVTPTILSENREKVKMSLWVDSVFATMTLDEKIGQLFIITVDPSSSKSYQEKLSGYIRNQKIGGILFSKSTIESQAKVTNSLQSQSRIPLFVTLDGEWGLSMRIEGTQRFPKNIALGALSDVRKIYEYGREVARQCKIMGIQINFAPVLDINFNPSNPVINVRSFGENRQRVTDAAIAYAEGLESEGILSVGKHFPGHGDTHTDSHFDLPILNLSLARIDSLELYPFKEYINKGLSGLMVGHLYLPAFNKDTVPASLSHSVVSDLLKNELQFEGLIFTDALMMKGANRNSESASVRALLAGNDVLLSPLYPVSEFESVKRAVLDSTISMRSIESKCRKLLTYKYLTGLNHYKPIDLNRLVERLTTRQGEKLIQETTSESLTLLKNDRDIIPLKSLEKESIAIVTLGDKNTPFDAISRLYAQTTTFAITESTTTEELKQMALSLKEYSRVIIGIYLYGSSYPKKLNEAIAQLNETNKLILSFFVSPYRMIPYREVVKKSSAVLMGYESTPTSQSFASQLLFGGIDAKGKLTVSVDDLFQCGDGLITQKCRLSYQIPEVVGLNSDVLTKIDSLVNESIVAEATPGCQVLVAKNGAVVYHKAFGFFDYNKSHKVELIDLYDLASLTKAAATTPALMMLYDQGKFQLKDKLKTFIPKLKNSLKGDINIGEALFHNSGLTAYIPFNQMLFEGDIHLENLTSPVKSEKYPLKIDEHLFAQHKISLKKEFISEKQDSIYSVKMGDGLFLNPLFHEKMMDRVISSKLGAKHKYVYSDLNFMLLQQVVETLTHTTLDSFLNKLLYSKLGATTTGYLPLNRFSKQRIAPTENDQFFRKQFLVGYVHDELAALYGGVAGNAGLFSNANDLAKYCQMLLNGGRYGGEEFISPKTVDLFIHSKTPDSRRALGFDRANPIRPSQGPTSDLVSLSTYGHTGFTGTCFWIDPENELIYIFLSNRVCPVRWNKKLNEMNTRILIQDVIYKSMQK